MMSVRASTILRLLKIQAVFSVLYIVSLNSRFSHLHEEPADINSISVDSNHNKNSNSNYSAHKSSAKERIQVHKHAQIPNAPQVTNPLTKTWIAKSPWDAPPDGFFSENDTGSLQNCTSSDTPSSSSSQSSFIQINPETSSGSLTISCQTIHFKAPYYRIQNVGPLIIGVLSAASGSGPTRRSYIRQTWAHSFKGTTFFLVAGPWKDVEEEFWKHRDLIWIDEEEVYQGEQSVLTYKTISYFAIAHLFGKSVEDGGWMHAIKTDDDSYVNVGRMMEKLTSKEGEFRDYHYYGQCPQFQVLPSRDQTNKWPVTYKTYPEPKFPLYCQGAGFGLSRTLVRTAVEGEHVARFRYMPFEDVSIGILAERCGKEFHAEMIPGVKVFRADTPKERDCVNHSVPMSKCFEGDESWPPDANMRKQLIQHRVDGMDDMVRIHKSLDLQLLGD